MLAKPIYGGLLGLFIVVVFSVLARLTFLDGSLFSPDVTPGIGPFALGDILAIGAFAIGFLAIYLKSKT